LRRAIVAGLVAAGCAGGFGPGGGSAASLGTAADDGDSTTASAGGSTGAEDGATSTSAGGETETSATGPGGSGPDGGSEDGATTVGGERCEPVDETCNGLDDDCDDAIDEDLVQDCSTACGAGSETCTAGAWSGCTAPPPQAESCDLDDDDCNGVVDDGLVGCRVSVHRSYHPSSGEHFYTTDLGEAQCCGYQVENDDYFRLYAGAQAGLTAFYRCVLGNGFHFYTTDAGCEGNQVEGTLGWIATSQLAATTALYRAWNPGNNDHLFTIDAAELAGAVAGGWVDEGTVGWVWTP
jgi:hypothetical protein